MSEAIPKLSPEDYLVLERSSPIRHEYLNGDVFMMGGASAAHSLITANLTSELRQALKKEPCRVYANDLRVKVADSNLYTYPDVVVTCGAERFDDAQKDTLLNPLVLIEVLSDSTEAYDRGNKFAHYRKLESLKHYLLVEQRKAHVECYSRQGDGGWILTEAGGLEAVIDIAALECKLELAEVYDKVEFGV